ncbi:protein spinster homolog 1 [Tetranychus urticae]|uniref:Major facilitator superfamily (MFS) profile domain-containing protein n=1 Tax=Tetranychus urticae TaxID=32264 RepID=T1KKM4_TETUR|nr:protein spinster homolog 1 [Tetranychus urticae]
MDNTKKYVAVGILCFINLINYMDRFTVAGVLPDITKYYSLSDAEGGSLQSAFIVSYMVMAPLFGYLGDRYSRKNLMAVGVFFWSITTYLGSIIPANAKGWFIFMRAMVGIGEASYSTIAPTIIADLFIGDLRTKVLGLFFFAIPVGSGMGFIVGDLLSRAFGSWKYALRLTPMLGLFSIFLMLIFLEEPQRGQADGASNLVKSTLKTDIRYLIKIPSYIWSTLGFTCVCFTTGSLTWWAPTFMQAVFKLQDGKDHDGIPLIFGVITCIGGIVGVLTGTYAAQYLRKKTHRADPLICSASVFISTPFIFLSIALATSVPTLSWISIAIGVTLLCINWTLVADMLLYIIVPHRRAFAQSIQILISHLLGDATSPYIIGLISDAIKSSKSFTSTNEAQAISLQYSLYTNCIVLILGGVAFLYNSYYIKRDQDICTEAAQDTYGFAIDA